MAFCFETVLRQTKTARGALRLKPSADHDLTFIDSLPDIGIPILLDTCAILDGLRGKAPAKLRTLVQNGLIHHSSIVLGEVSRPFGVLDPAHQATARNLAPLRAVLNEVRPHRVIEADAEMIAIANIRAGIVARHLALPRESQSKVVNDALIAAQAARYGLTLITANRRDFDLLAQLDPRLRVAFYRV
jgi:predicted nucleic acid-binding protein